MSDLIYTTNTVAIINNLDETESQNIDKINSCISSESSREIEIIANTSQNQTQKCITNFVVDSKVPYNIKTINQVNNQDKLAVDQNIITKIIQDLLEELFLPDRQLQDIKFFFPRTLILGSISIKKLANFFYQANVARNKLIIAKFKDKKLVDKTTRSQIYAEMKLYLVEQVKSKTITSHVNKIPKTIATSIHNMNNSSNRISDITVYFNEEVFKEEETNELIERVSKKFKVITKAPEAQVKPLVLNKYDIYFDKDLKKDEEESNEVKSNNDSDSSNFTCSNNEKDA
ncbi:3026_t:CDS:2, partial [Dentiscutata heterogama]